MAHDGNGRNHRRLKEVLDGEVCALRNRGSAAVEGKDAARIVTFATEAQARGVADLRERKEDEGDATESQARRWEPLGSAVRDTAGTSDIDTVRCINGRDGQDIPASSARLGVGSRDDAEKIGAGVAAKGSSPH